ncbi:MAG: hypothetical protein E7592_02215 [Ruminococcaceae bacterium]|nr:hypothetical protein [Oscillospiraceae bacterium]
MAQFTNQAQLSYNNTVVNSNVVVGEILEGVSADKTAVVNTYSADSTVTYVISIVNSGNTAISNLTVTDDLGAYEQGTETRTPLSYVDGSIRLFVNGVLQAAPVVTSEPALVVSGITLPANSNLLLVYTAEVNEFAPLGADDSIVNTATVTGNGISTPITATETVTPIEKPQLRITKSVEPVPVSENGTLTYRFVIENFGNVAATAEDNVALSDLFDPILSDITVSLDGTTWTEGVQYNYNEATGQLNTVLGQITVPAATYTQDIATGVWSITPGVTVLTVSGTV